MKTLCFVGIDTSNYTTSLAIAGEDGQIIENRKLPLKVKTGEVGLRQSDAVFLHTKNLPQIVKNLSSYNIKALGVSARPRDEDGSYMPCFLAGISAASAVTESLGIPMYEFSHQAGHVRAAKCSSGMPDCDEYLAFHVSGGTTDVLYVHDDIIDNIGGTLDLNAGQAIDRIGVMLGLEFPCGALLENLALKNKSKIKTNVCVKGTQCNLSGLENKARVMKEKGVSDTAIAAYVIEFISKTVEGLTEGALKEYPSMPVLYSGGVMSNKIIASNIKSRFDAYFAEPQFSCDNAAGTALLAKEKYEREKNIHGN